MQEILARVGSNEIPRLFYLQQRGKRMHRTLIALMKSQTGAPNSYSFNEESNGRILSF